MTLLTARAHLEHILSLEPDLLRHASAQVRKHPPHIVQVESRVEREDVTVAGRAGDVAMRGARPFAIRLPDLMAARTGPSAGVLIIEARPVQDEQRREDYRGKEPDAPFKRSRHHRALGTATFASSCGVSPPRQLTPHRPSYHGHPLPKGRGSKSSTTVLSVGERVGRGRRFCQPARAG